MVLDEADTLLEKGFKGEVEAVLKPLRNKPKPAVCALVVATFTQVSCCAEQKRHSNQALCNKLKSEPAVCVPSLCSTSPNVAVVQCWWSTSSISGEHSEAAHSPAIEATNSLRPLQTPGGLHDQWLTAAVHRLLLHWSADCTAHLHCQPARHAR